MPRSAALKRGSPTKARSFRRNSTQAETKFWNTVRNRQIDGLKFRRQASIGPYVADFLCAEHKLIVEIDGGQHADNPKDIARTQALEGLGYKVLRFWNNEVLANLDGVIETVRREATPHRPAGGRPFNRCAPSARDPLP